MTKPHKKKLIEVAIPLEAINAASAREKSIRHGHPSTLHLWWARRPLAACRAVLFAQLVDDPSSLPDQFPTAELQDAERKRLFAIIEDLVKWENSTNGEVLERARAEIRRSCGGVLPPVYDPFSGGGSIPLEAQRLGLPAYGSDLNPVAVMIGKAMIEIPPKFKDQKPVHPGIKDRNHYRNAEGLAEDVTHYAKWMRDRAWERIGHLYPQVNLPKELGGQKATIVGWIWSRTVPSPDPAFSDIHVPITSSFLVCAKEGKESWVEPIVDRVAKTISYQIRNKGTKSEIERANQGTKGNRANFTCLFSGAAINADYIKKKGQTGEMGQSLLAVVVEGKGGRLYLAPDDVQNKIAFSDEAATVAKEARETFLSGETPAKLTGGTCHAYGLNTWGKLFTDRQLYALKTFSDLVHEVRQQVEKDAKAAGHADDSNNLSDGGTSVSAYADAIGLYLGLCIGRMANRASSLCFWDQKGQNVQQVFARQALPMTWDFVEGNIFSDSTGNFLGQVGYLVQVVEALPASSISQENQEDARDIKFLANAVLNTDPPYYDNIGYADLSDYFYVWLRPALRGIFPEMTSVLATPKAKELVASSYRHGGREKAEEYFLNGMKDVLQNAADGISADFPAAIYYAFKASEFSSDGLFSPGWATFIQALLDAGFSLNGTWPVRSEYTGNLKKNINALSNSVVLVCRKKPANAEIITRAEFIRELKRELPSAIKELQAANIAPADMPQSAIGPGMGVFSRYRAVLESDDSPMSVKAALQLINRELDEYLGGIQGEFDADTRFAITWFEQNGMKAGDYGTAASIAQARGISVDSVKHAGIVESQAGKVRVLRRDELDDKWDPGTDQHLTIWECLQYLVRLHEKDGISQATAVLL